MGNNGNAERWRPRVGGTGSELPAAQCAPATKSELRRDQPEKFGPRTTWTVKGDRFERNRNVTRPRFPAINRKRSAESENEMGIVAYNNGHCVIG